ncbi:MAG: hypothetical protein WAM52_02505 [Steroidobacteraceae bacterium]
MQHQVLPLQGWGLLRFGMSRAEVRAAMGGAVESRKRNQFSATAYDFFPAQGVFAYYRVDDTLEAVELAKPASALIEGMDLLDSPFEDAERFLSSKADPVERDADGLTCYLLGVSLYAPDARDDPQSKPESVLIFCTGYFD